MLPWQRAIFSCLRFQSGGKKAFRVDAYQMICGSSNLNKPDRHATWNHANHSGTNVSTTSKIHDSARELILILEQGYVLLSFETHWWDHGVFSELRSLVSARCNWVENSSKKKLTEHTTKKRCETQPNTDRHILGIIIIKQVIAPFNRILFEWQLYI